MTKITWNEKAKRIFEEAANKILEIENPAERALVAEAVEARYEEFLKEEFGWRPKRLPSLERAGSPDFDMKC